jgi:hypothetical protein
MPPALAKAKLIIELQVDTLEEHELAQITAWLRERASSIEVQNAAKPMRVANILRDTWKRLQAQLRARLLRSMKWTLARLGTTTGA